MFDVTEDSSDRPTIKQLSVFLPNRVGALLAVTRCLDHYAIRIWAIAILDAADHAVVRLVVDRPGLAEEALRTEGYSVHETELLGVALPEGGPGIRAVLSALLMAELNVHYVYTLLTSTASHNVLALHVENIEGAIQVLERERMQLIGQDQLE